MKRYQYYIVILGLAAVLLGAWYVSDVKEKEAQRKYEALQAEAESYEEQKNDLLKQIRELDREYEEATKSIHTEELLFLQPRSVVYEEIEPMMKKAGWVGVIGLGQGCLPGDDGMMSTEQYQELLRKGWSACLHCEDASRFLGWYEELAAELQARELDIPDAVFFSGNDYSEQMNPQVKRCGFRTVIHNGENGLAVGSSEYKDEIWYATSCPWNYSGVKPDIQRRAGSGGNIVYVVDFNGTRGAEYVDTKFLHMVEFVEPYVKDGLIQVTDLESARKKTIDELENVSKTSQRIDQEREKLQSQLKELQEKIDEIYAGW